MKDTQFEKVDDRIRSTFEEIEQLRQRTAAGLKIVRDKSLYVHSGFTSFEEYCNSQIAGGFERVSELLENYGGEQ